MAARQKTATKKVKSEALPVYIRFQYVLVFAFSVLIFFNSVFNDYNMDDELVTKNHRLTSQGIKAIPEILTSPYYSDNMGYKYEYRPVVLISFAIEHQLLGENPHISHLINLLLYALLCVCLLKVLNALTGSGYGIFNLLVVLLFAAHPLHTEAVDNIKNRDELLSLLFALLATQTALKYYVAGKWYNIILSVIFLALGILSKQNVINFVFLIPLALFLFKPLRFGKLTGYTFALTVCIITLANIPLIFEKIFLALFNIGFFVVWAGYKNIFFFMRKVFFSTGKQVKHVIANGAVRIRVAAGFAVNKIKTAAAGALASASERMEASQSFMEPPVTLPGWANLAIFAFIISSSIAAAVLLKDKTGLVAGGLVALVYLLLMGQVRYKSYVFYLLTMAIIAMAWFWNNKLIYEFIFIFYIFCANEKIWGRYRQWQLYAQIALLGVFSAWLGGPEWDIGVVLGPVLFLYVSSRIPWVWARLLWLAIALAMDLTAKHGVTIYSIVTALALISTALFFITGNNRRLSMAIGRIFIACMPVFICVVLISGKDYLAHQPLRIYTPHPDKGLPAAAKYTPSTAQRITRILTGNAAFAPQQSVRPLTYVEFPVDSNAPATVKAGTSLIVMGHYLKKLLIPCPLGFYYGYAIITPQSVFNYLPVAVLLIHFFILYCAFYFARSNPLISFGCFIYLAGVAVYSNLLVPIPGMMADRFLLIPSIGYCLLLVIILLKLCGLVEKNISLQKLPLRFKALGGAILVSYVIVTINRNFQWLDAVTLMRHDIAYLDESAQAHNLLASHLNAMAEKATDPAEQSSLREEAVMHYKRCIEISPVFFNAVFDAGRTFALLNKPDSALVYFKAGIPLHPNFITSHINIADIYINQGRLQDAVPYLAEAIRLMPKDYEAYDKLSYVYFRLNEFDKALQVNKNAVVEMPENYMPFVNLGRTFIGMNQMDSAGYYLKKADVMSPNNQMVKELIRQAGQ